MSRTTRLSPRLFVLAALSIPAATLDAAAGPIDNHGVWLGDWADRTTKMLADPSRYHVEDSAASCEAAIASARADGITDTQRVASYNFKGHPSAQPVERRMVWSLTLAEVQTYCDSIRTVETFAAERHVFEDATSSLAFYSNENNVHSVAMSADTLAEQHDLAERCRTAWDRLHALGLPHDLPGGGRMKQTFGALRSEVCDPLDDAVDAYAKAAQAAADALREKWERAGLGGEKLQLMMDYDGTYWYLRGGDRTDDPKRLARAKVTFQWWTGRDAETRVPTHTIRKYRWNGNELAGMSERVYYGDVDDRAFR